MTHFYKSVQFTNQDIFDAIDRQWDLGISKPICIADLERRAMTLDISEFHFIGQMLGAPLCINHNGEFKVGYPDDLQNEWEKQRQAQYAILGRKQFTPKRDDGCKHRGFVVRDDNDGNKYLCKECGARFPHHPWLPQPQSDLDDYAFPTTSIEDAMLDFRAGMVTFSNACRRAAVSANEFKEAIKQAFPPQKIIEEMFTIGNPNPIRLEAGYEPQRTSDPEDIENIFTTPGVSKEDLQKIWETAFDDITEIHQHFDPATDTEVITFGFVDGTEQRVEISRRDHMKQALQLYNSGAISNETFRRYVEDNKS